MAFFRYNGGMSELAVVIQAGGESSRMGEDKGLLLFEGEHLVEFIHNQMLQLRSPVIMISNSPEQYRGFGVPVFSDILPGIGALGGLITALTYSPLDSCLLLACDMPFIEPRLIDALLKKSKGADVVIPIFNGRPEPFRAIYRRTCIDPISEMIRQGKRRMISFFEHVSVVYIDEEIVKRLDPAGRSFININTIEDLERAKSFLNNSLNT